jgi:hypothetical protein
MRPHWPGDASRALQGWLSFGRLAFPACAAVGWKNQAASSAAPQLFTFEEFAAEGFTHVECFCPDVA